MHVSVVIAAYNAEAYIAEAIESVLGQTVPPDELIVVDDGSRDGTRSVLDRFGSRIIALTQENSGQAVAVNKGLALARGELIGFCDADDLWTARKLEMQLALLEHDRSVEAAFGKVQQFVSPDVPQEHRVRLTPDVEIMLGELKQCMLIRRAALTRIDPFDESLPATFFIAWLGRAKQNGLKTAHVDEIVVQRRLHLGNGGRTNTDAQNLQTLMALRQAIKAQRSPE
ncbi:glycosyltransferase family 2 protein [Bradyrhizobium xenonodulans]|uniref:Glycosyltransferase family 2 protein n=1 Tax=Bradyrhizobium xenonodulans TaxID=2736875 RepID=A0ABY7MDC4_9BRAD|nr:glycosyltransferase family A protein [Bradyrhizobium xenonodulans]WBL76373.1 glycosyltransferase family 2 protein [Bradyrhizobium xenonodulans]